MNSNERKIAMEIMNAMISKAYDIFEQKGLEHFLHFKIEAREVRSGDWSLGESIVVDEIKEFEKNETN